jgi:hypothetical protein
MASRRYAERVPIPNAYHIAFSGPKDAEPVLVSALTQAGLAAEMCSSLYESEASLGWVRVIAHEGHDAPPSPEFQGQIRNRASGIAQTLGYSERSSGNTVAVHYHWPS